MKKTIVYLFIVIIIIFFAYKILKSPLQITQKDITISVGENYKEPGFKASKMFKDLKKDVIVSNNIDKNKIGDYEVVYSLNYKNKEYKQIRKVKVVDKEAPEIILKGSKNTLVCPNKIYEEEGFLALDNYDGIITNKVKVKKRKYEIIYMVEDSSGNKKEVIRKIKYGDITKPKIKLKEPEVKLSLNHPYYENGFSASDNCDGDISKNVKTIGNVNYKKAGEYKVKYSVSDYNGNQKETYRTVKVGNFNDKVIYLTFDDGPNNITTKFLDVLKEKNVKATFFVTGVKIDALKHIVRRAYDEGHTIALHTFSHNYQRIYRSENAYFNDLETIREKVLSITGENTKIIRFPGGSSNTISRNYKRGIMSKLTEMVTDRGYIFFDWNVSSGDAGGTKDENKIYKNVVSNLHDGENIVLMHDADKNTGSLNALSRIIDYGIKNGYTFSRITENTDTYHHTIHN